MKLTRGLSLLVLAGFALATPIDKPAVSEKVSYDGYKAYRVSLPSSSDADNAFFDDEDTSFIELHRRREKSGTWAVDIAVAPRDIPAFFEVVGRDNVAVSVLSHDLGADFAAESVESVSKGKEGEGKGEGERERRLPGLEWFDAYHPYADHVTYWADLHAAFPNNSELIVAGTSFEGRPVQGIHLWGKGGKDSKEAIFFNGNVHAREWITSMVVEYILYQIVTGYETDELVQKVLDNYDFYVLPVVNPDGFVYTQTTNRLWRKNRQIRSNTTAIGTDINRNWAVGFGGDGSSPNPSSETFSGFAPFDAPETAALATYTRKLRDLHGIKLYVDWHSYAQTILLSYGYTCTDFPGNYDEQYDLAQGIASAIKGVYGTAFEYGSGCLVLYQSSGNGRDYVTDVGKAQFGWGIELRDTQYGFMLPPEQILPSGIEIWEGLKYAWTQF
ncbi:hypothetical protein F5B22DRAFT_1138 [Xylaria bambusicola]|uniref:uncharacterized protein n=1 Tax=Xylaria bambusicola TaxID=326684 RepID=UPI002007B82B|nr:uncharacterized protein F5B22DRAFT_1138 [Xylaria bambusicola]KAI0527735.1 hypothetical protein F5B22DRAFT_1138 [Xylaria bambusicola]